MTTLKTKKICAGYYKGVYKGVEFDVIRVEELPNSEIAWYWQIGMKPVEDWHPSKAIAIKAAIEYINDLKNKA